MEKKITQTMKITVRNGRIKVKRYEEAYGKRKVVTPLGRWKTPR